MADEIKGKEESNVVPTPPTAPPAPAPPPPPPGGKIVGKKLPTSSGNALSNVLAGIKNQQQQNKSQDRSLSSMVTKGAHYFMDKSATGLVGLYNQGATCYMNSLLQSLYMLPGVREQVFRFRYDPKRDGSNASRCIVLQLQKLFARLLVSPRLAVPTKPLTTSFGWKEGVSFQQHDVQELRLLLFDALDKAHRIGGFGSAEEESWVNQLFQGVMGHYTFCSRCKTRNERPEPFYDLQLPARECATLDQCLSAFLAADLLHGENQYACSRCECKTDAEKGIRLLKLPPVLTLSIKRFDYDPRTWRPVKLQHRISFPMVFDPSALLSSQASQAATAPASSEEKKDTNSNQTNSSTEKRVYQLHAILVHNGGAGGGHYYGYVRDPMYDPSLTQDKVTPLDDVKKSDVAADSLTTVESATAEEKKSTSPASPKDEASATEVEEEKEKILPGWYKMDDSRVTPMSEKQLEQSFGSDPKKKKTGQGNLTLGGGHPIAAAAAAAAAKLSSTIGASTISKKEDEEKEEKKENTSLNRREAKAASRAAALRSGGASRFANAYMLVYRETSLPKALSAQAQRDLLPEGVLKELDEEAEKWQEERKEHIRQLHTLKLRTVLVHTPAAREVVSMTPEESAQVQQKEEIVRIHRDCSLEEATTATYECFCESGALNKNLFARDQVRFRPYNRVHALCGASFTSDQLSSSLLQLKIPNLGAYALEVRAADESWGADEAMPLLVSVMLFDAKKMQFGVNRLPVRLSSQSNVGDLCQAIGHVEGVVVPEDHEVRVVMVDADTFAGTVLMDNQATLTEAGLYDGITIHAEIAPKTSKVSDSLLISFLDTQKHLIEIRFNCNPMRTANQQDQWLDTNVDSRWTIGQLKDRLCEMAGVPIDKVRICRNALGRQEYKDSKMTLEVAQLFDGSAVYLKPGRPAGLNTYRFRLFAPTSLPTLLSLPTRSPSVSDSTEKEKENQENELQVSKEDEKELQENQATDEKDEKPKNLPPPPPSATAASRLNAFKRLEDIHLDATLPILEIKKIIADHLQETLPDEKWSADLLRIREKSGTRMARLLLPEKTLSYYFTTLRDGIELAIQKIVEKESLNENSLLIGLRCWSPSNWNVEDGFSEFVLDRNSTVGALRQKIAASLQVDASFIAISKQPFRLDPYAIATGNWAPQEDRSLGGSPWYLKTGDIVLWKDVREKDKHDVSGMGVSMYGNGNVHGGGGGPSLSIEFYSAELEKQEEDELARILKESEETAKREAAERAAKEALQSESSQESTPTKEEGN